MTNYTPTPVILAAALSLALGCNTKKAAPEAPPPDDSAEAEAESEENAASSGATDGDLYGEDPFAGGGNEAAESKDRKEDETSSDDDKDEEEDADTSTSKSSTTDIMSAFNDVKNSGPKAPDTKEMFGRAALQGALSVMPTLLGAAMNGQRVDLGRVALSAAYSTGVNMQQQYAQQNQLSQQQYSQQQQLAAQQQYAVQQQQYLSQASNPQMLVQQCLQASGAQCQMDPSPQSCLQQVEFACLQRVQQMGGQVIGGGYVY